MSILADLRAGTIEMKNLNAEQKAQGKAELQAEQDLKVQAEAAASRKTHASAERQRGLNETVGPQQPKPVRSAETGAFSGPVEGIDPEARAAATQNRADDIQRATGLDRSATPQFQEPTPAAVNAAAADRARGGPASPALGRDLAPPIDSRTSPQATRINRNRKLMAGATALGLGAAAVTAMEEFEISPAQVLAGAGVAGGTAAGAYTLQQREKIKAAFTDMVAERRESKASFRREAAAVRAGDEPGAATERTAREQRGLERKISKAGGVIESGVVDSDTAARAVDVEDRPMSNAQQKKVDSLQGNIDTANERKRRAQRTINTSQNPADVAAAREAITAADRDIQGATSRQATTRAEARTPTPVTDAVERAKTTVKQPAAVGDDVVNKASAALDDTISKVDDATKEGLKKGKNIFNKAIDKGKAAFAGLRGGGSAAASASVAAGVDEMTKDMPDGPEKASAVRALGTLGKAAGVVGLVDMAGSYLRNVYETDFRTANVDLIEGITQLIEASGETIEGVRAGDIGMDEVVVDLARGVVDGIAGVIPSIVDNGQFFAGEAFDAALGLPGAEVGSSPTGLRDAGVSDPSSLEFTGPADPGELPGVPGERFDPLGTQPSLAPVTQDPFLEQGTQDGQFDIRGLRGGTGTIDAGGATGGPSGFAQRVEESRRAGAFEPVSQERRDEATRDLDRVRRGTAAFRDLAATRLGVPTQYLDAVRSGAMTPREANLAQAKQAATGNLPQAPTAAEQQNVFIKGNQELRDQSAHTGKRIDDSIRRFNEVGQEVMAAFPDADEAQRADINTGFQSWASGWLPEGKDPADYTRRDLQTVKGHYILATELADKGEGWLRSLDPRAPDLTANTLFGRGENLLLSMSRQGQWFDIGDDNLKFVGRDSSGRDVELTIQPEDLHPVAQAVINEARGTVNIIKQGLQRQ